MEDKKLTTARLYEDIRRITGTDISPADLAKRLNESPQTVNNWSTRGISNEGLIKAAVEFYGLDIYYIKVGERKTITIDRRASSVKNMSLNDLLKTKDPLQKMADKMVEIFVSLSDNNQELLQLMANKMYEYDHPTDSRANGKKLKQTEKEQQ
jgi:hypothetical protein